MQNMNHLETLNGPPFIAAVLHSFTVNGKDYWCYITWNRAASDNPELFYNVSWFAASTGIIHKLNRLILKAPPPKNKCLLAEFYTHRLGLVNLQH